MNTVPIINSNPYPIHLLPPLISDAIYEVQAYNQAPLELVATSAIAAIASACQGLLDVRIPTGDVAPTSLYLLTIAESGERKTSTDKLFSEPALNFEKQQQAKHQGERLDYTSQLEIWEIKHKTLLSQIKKAIKKGGSSTEELELQLQELNKVKPISPALPKIIYADATIEALLNGLHQDWPYATFSSSEASVTFSKLSIGQLGHLNTLWDGGDITIDRKSKESFVLHDARFSASLMIQNEPFQQFLQRKNNHARTSGFLSRMLVANPPSTQGRRFSVTNRAKTMMPYLNMFHQRMTDIYTQTLSSRQKERLVLDFLPAARRVWHDFYQMTEKEMGPYAFGSDIRDAMSKVPNNMARMAALFHYFSGKEGAIDQASANAAVQVCIWHMKEFKRLFAPKDDITSTLELAERLYEWLVKRYHETNVYRCLKTMLYSYAFKPLRTKSNLEPVLDLLISQGKIFYFIPNLPYAYSSRKPPIFIDLNLAHPMMPARQAQVPLIPPIVPMAPVPPMVSAPPIFDPLRSTFK